MDLLYVLDHAEVAKEILRSERGLREELWQGWLRILVAMQATTRRERRLGTGMEQDGACEGVVDAWTSCGNGNGSKHVKTIGRPNFWVG